MKTVFPIDLKAAISSDAAPLVLDVRLADDFEAARLPGAVNNCVFDARIVTR